MDSSEIRLKPPQETFVDEPCSLEDIDIDELAFDLEHGFKDINKLNSFHAISIFSSCLQDIIKLQADELLFTKFRKQQLEKLLVDIDILQGEKKDGYADTKKVLSEKLRSPSVSPPLKFARLHNNFEGTNDDFMKDRTPDSLFNEDRNEDYTLNGNAKNEASDEIDPPYIRIDELLNNTSIEKVSNRITLQDSERLRTEIKYHLANQVSSQNALLLKSFNLVSIPTLSIEQFLMRIKTYSSSTSVLVYINSAYLIFKLCILLDIVPLTDYNVHRLILALIRSLTKILEDVYQKQKSFVTVGGVNVKDLFKIEMGFLYLCNFKLVTGEEILNTYLKEEFTQLRKFCNENFNDDKHNTNGNELDTETDKIDDDR
mmetsp:Transcript_5454/g.6350  ORF Transcript_5454/g.6350 Transcript_5454/m.6350 type:complete len:372 (-) Transcript_5454:72-1187(-)